MKTKTKWIGRLEFEDPETEETYVLLTHYDESGHAIQKQLFSKKQHAGLDLALARSAASKKQSKGRYVEARRGKA